MLSVDVDKKLGDFTVSANVTTQGGATVLFGPSGSGKTSLVNMVAGLVTPDRGRISLDDTVLFDAAGGVNVPASRRGFGYVFQEGRLFPHLSVNANLHFGRWVRGKRRDPATTQRVVDLLGIGPLLKRRTGALSGGERQRIAIGRALLMEPRLLLFDEPLVSLDEERKSEILPFLENLRDEARIPMIYVTHNVAEAMVLATHVVRIEAGRVTARGGIELLK